MRRIHKDSICCLLFFMQVISGPAWSIEVQPFDYVIKAHGVVIVPPCHINNDTVIDVDFGTVGINQVVTKNIEKTIWIPITCEDSETPISVKITGDNFENYSNVLATTKTGLGVVLTQQGNDIPLNSFFLPEQLTGFHLTTTLKATAAFTQEEGNFQANATIGVQYE